MASSYPSSLDALATNKADATAMATDHKGHHNDLADAVNKIEAELGVLPKGSALTVSARVAATEIGSAGDYQIGGTLAIGTAPGGTAFVIQNSSDRTGILVTGHSTQTGNLIQVRNSSLQDIFKVSGIGEVYSAKTSGSDLSYIAHVQGDVEIRWGVRANGEMLWGTGAAGPDVNLKRYAADRLGTDDDFILSKSDGSLIFGTGADVSLFRSAADQLKTNDEFVVNLNMGATFLPIQANYNGTLKSLQVGATDSGGSGYRMVRISN